MLPAAERIERIRDRHEYDIDAALLIGYGLDVVPGTTRDRLFSKGGVGSFRIADLLTRMPIPGAS